MNLGSASDAAPSHLRSSEQVRSQLHSSVLSFWKLPRLVPDIHHTTIVKIISSLMLLNTTCKGRWRFWEYGAQVEGTAWGGEARHFAAADPAAPDRRIQRGQAPGEGQGTPQGNLQTRGREIRSGETIQGTTVWCECKQGTRTWRGKDQWWCFGWSNSDVFRFSFLVFKEHLTLSVVNIFSSCFQFFLCNNATIHCLSN